MQLVVIELHQQHVRLYDSNMKLVGCNFEMRVLQ
jgi:hypothetical protein